MRDMDYIKGYYNRHNPVMGIPYGRGSNFDLDPFKFRRQLEGNIERQLDKLQRDLWKWLGKYGISDKGYTFISRKDYHRKLKEQFGKRLEKKVSKKFFDCDGAILVSETKHANLARILLLDGWNADSLERIANLYWDNFDFPETDADLDARMQVVLQLLRHEFDSLAHNKGFYVSREASPFIFKPDDKHHYKAVNYRVIPVYAYIRRTDATSY